MLSVRLRVRECIPGAAAVSLTRAFTVQMTYRWEKFRSANAAKDNNFPVAAKIRTSVWISNTGMFL